MDNNFQIFSAVVSDRGLSEKRPQNEDSYLAMDELGIYAVADGVGGAQAGDVASQMAMEILGEAFANYTDRTDPEEILAAAIARANQAIYQMASELPQLSSMATTIAAVHISGNIATIAHVGDSRVYRLSPDGFLSRETDDHSVVEEEVRAGRMTAEQAANHPSRNVISRALGAEQDVDVDLRTIMIEPGTVFLLCSDGITRHVSDDEIDRILNTGMTPALICEHLKELCYERGAEDNLTAVVVTTQLPQQTTLDFPETTPAALFRDEEETIASARSPFDETVDDYESTFPTEQDITPALADLGERDEIPHLIDEPIGKAEPEQGEYRSSAVVVQAAQQAKDDGRPMFGISPNINAEHEPSTGSSVYRVLISLLFVALGIAAGAAAVYIWTIQTAPQQIAEPTPQLVQKSNDIQVSALEESRRLVDSDPQAYLNARAASPEDAADHYLLGRALLLTGKYFEAKRQFSLAKEKLTQADPKEVKTLATEIAMANAIIENGPATEMFKKETESVGTGSPAANTAPVR